MSRSAIIIAIDSSISMQEWTMFHNTRMRKMDAAALIANFAIDELVTRSKRSEQIRDYYDIAIIQYSGDGIEYATPNHEEEMVHINRLHEALPQPVCYNIVHIDEDGTKKTIPINLHEWVKPKAIGISPMYEALVHIKNLISTWCSDSFNRRSFPPIVINITDGCCGDAEDFELIELASEIQKIGTKDGTTLLVNIYLANEIDDTSDTLFPRLSEHFSEEHDCQMLYDMSSVLPEELEYAMKYINGCSSIGPYKCFARNASVCEILTITDIGTEECHRYN